MYYIYTYILYRYIIFIENLFYYVRQHYEITANIYIIFKTIISLKMCISWNLAKLKIHITNYIKLRKFNIAATQLHLSKPRERERERGRQREKERKGERES